ncbi:Pectinesterase inhibitor domain containing protein [Trema orientale]|uniref:Pectinesterase inhibitor domain containing protein n=1 Tax=Trema orientale TaxID=63057 RepID=A0A2P5F5T2_TREOI|nr:Pectinesterase inhibitor domain containing protein [Trema orientale]
MKKSLKPLSLTFLVSFYSVSFLAELSQCRVLSVNLDLIQKTCKQTPNYDLCVSSLQSDPRSSNADVRGLALIMVDVLTAKARETLNHIHELLEQSPKPDQKQPLSCCNNYYEAILEGDVPEAIEALTKGNYKFAEQGSDDAAIEAELCEKKFASGTSPLTDMNKVVHDVAAVTAAMTRILLSS